MVRLVKQYGLKDPQQIKMRIILWMTLQKILLMIAGDSPTNRKVLAHFDGQWKRIEQYEKNAA